MLALLPVLVVSSVGRRFSSVATRVEVESDQVTMSRPCERRWAGAQVLDVWHDERAEGTNEARVIVASRSRPEACADLTLLDFENAAQAKRFAEAFKPRPTTVAGHCPSPVDALPSLRFLAIAAAFFGTGSWFGAFALAYFLFGAFALVRAKQIIATSEGVEIHGLFATQRLPYATIASVDADAGGIALSDGSELALPRAATCDSNLGAPPWLDPARARVFERIVSRTKRFGGPKSPETSA